jgi:DNA-binding PadR family transcriptional regulator
MSLTHAILGVLEARPMTGYELVQFFDQSMNWVWSAPQSQIYPRLRDMEERGLIDGKKEIRGEKLERTVYSLTDDGFEELVGWVADGPDPTPQRDGLFLQAVFFDMVDAEKAAAVLQRFIDEQEELIDQWSEHRDRLAAKDTPLIRERLRRRPKKEHDRVAALKAHVFEGKIAVAEARVAWAKRGIKLLKAPSGKDTAAA